MFGRKPPEKPLEQIPVVTIPAEFYGGINPLIKFKTVEKEVSFAGLGATALEKKSFNNTTAAGAGQPLHPVNLFASRRFLVYTALGLFTLFAIGAGFYYWYQARPKIIKPASVSVPISEVVSDLPALVEPEPTEAPPSVPTSTVAEPPQQNSLTLPSFFLSKSPDQDKDGLTDIEEELFKTDPEVIDSDSDTYIDGSEMYHLYSPIDKDLGKLSASGLVKEFENPMLGYKLYYPVSWAVGPVDETYHDVLFSTITGEYIEVKVLDIEFGQTFEDWLAIQAPGEKLSDLKPLTNEFKATGWARRDGLVFYIVEPRRVTVVLYYTPDLTVNYPFLPTLFVRSLRLKGEETILVPRNLEGTVTTSSTR